jgi:hypothetical protein
MTTEIRACRDLTKLRWTDAYFLFALLDDLIASGPFTSIFRTFPPVMVVFARSKRSSPTR